MWASSDSVYFAKLCNYFLYVVAAFACCLHFHNNSSTIKASCPHTSVGFF